MSRGRLARYSLWQLRDFAIDRGIAILIIGVLFGYLAIEPIRRTLGPGWATNAAFPLARILPTIAVPVTTLAVFIALNGMVSSDRKMGYYRFLFSKPVRPTLYYAQLFGIHLLGVLLAIAILTGLFRVVVVPFPVSRIVLYAGVLYLAMGGIGFFISAATRYDWVVLATVWIGSRILRSVYGPTPDLRSKLVQLLPPVHRVDVVANALMSGNAAAASDLTWLVGYGVLFFVLGLLVISRRSFVD